MNNLFLSPRVVAASTVAFLFLQGLDAPAAVCDWTNTSGGNWSIASNWSPNQVPGATDTANITVAGNYSVTLDVSPTVAGLVLGASSAGTTQGILMGGQTLAVNGPIQVSSQGQFNLGSGALAGTNVLTGVLTWSGGSMAGNMTIAANSVLNIVAGGGNGFNGLVLTNLGTVTWSNTDIYSHGPNNAQIYNYGLWNAQSDKGFTGGYYGGSTLFDNFGTFLKSGGTNATVLDGGVLFNNTGTVNVESGTLDIEGGGTSSGGALETASGGTINCSGFLFTNTNTFKGSGNYVAGGATFGGTIEGTLNWDGGGLSGVMTLASNSVLNIVAGGGNSFYGLVLTNYGTVTWTNTDIYGHGPNNAQIYNYGLWNAQSDHGFYGGYYGGSTLFDNFGTFLKSGSTNTTTLDSGVVFNNTGTVNIQSGTLDIGGGTSSGGDFLTANGGSLNFISTPYNFTNTTTFAGTGGFMAAGATFNGTIAGTVGWDGGSLSGVLTLASNSVLNIVAGGGNGFYGLVLTNYGTVNWSNTDIYSHGPNNAQIYNYGLWNAQTNNVFTGGYYGGTTLFDNFGTFLKSGTKGTSVLDGGVVFNNSGAVEVESGTLDIEGGGVNSGQGTFVTANGALLGLDGITFANNATITSSTAVDLGGNTTINGVLTATNLQLVGGMLDGTNVLVGTLTWSGGSMSGNLTIASNSVLNIVAGGGNSFYGLVLTNYGTVNWTNADIYSHGPNTTQIYNYGLWNAQSDNEFYGGYYGGSTVFDNFGTFLKSGSTNATVLDGDVVFDNSGLVDVTDGTLNCDQGGTSSGGRFFTAGDGTINCSGFIFTNTNTFKGNGNYVAGGATFAGTIKGTLNWDGEGLSGVMTLASNSVLNIVAGGGNSFYGLVLTNYGTVNWTNADIYSHGPNTTQIYNYGLWNAQSDNEFYGGYYGGSTVFDNFGTFLKSGSTNTTTLDSDVAFNNAGTVSIQSGTLDIGGGTSAGGDFMTTNGGSLNFISTYYNFTNTTTFTGPNSFVASGATFNGTIAGTLGWNGGALSGVMTLASNGVLNIVAGGGYYFNGLILTNYGTVSWSNADIYSHGSKNAQIYNYGLWNAQSDNEFYGGYYGGLTVFDNFGTFLKSGNTNTTTLDSGVVFNNNGTVRVRRGTLSINGGGITSGSGVFVTANGAFLDLAGIDFANGATIDGNAAVDLGGNTVVNGVLTGSNLQLVGGTLSGTNVLQGTLTWSGGSMAGNLTIASNSVLNIVAGGGDAFDGLILTNFGTVNWTNTDIYSQGPDNAQIYNYGLWNAQNDNELYGGYYGGTTVFDNFGTFLKSGSTNTTVLDGDVAFNNTGTVNVESGALDLNGNISLDGGTLNFSINSQTDYGTIALAGATVLGGAVSVDFNNGFLPASGSQFQLLSGASLTGTLSTGALPFGMSFVYSKTGVDLVWNGITQAGWAAGTTVLYGTITTTFLESLGTTVQLVATTKGASYVLGATASGGLGTISFNASQLSNGIYSLQAIVVNAAGQVVGDYSRQAFVNNSLAWHEGILSSNQTWGTNGVNAVDENVIIPGGVTLTLAPGAIVKFAEGTGIIIEPGGVLDASGATTNEPIILTAMKDDSAGGDSNEDGDNSVPEPGDWNGILSSGQFLANAYVEVRYVLQTHSGLVRQSQEWSGPQEHFITGNVIVPTNVTLTISPGAIVKFDLGRNITVQAGGTLIATGTVAQPIVFTSINDGSVGVEMNTAATPAAAGDWDSIYISGGKAIFDHVTMSYGGGPDSLNSGLISTIGPGSVVAVSDSILNQALYRGIEAEYGTVNLTNCVVTGCDRGIQSGLSGPTVVNIINCTLDNNNYGLFAHGGVMNVVNSIIADSLTAGLAYCCGSSLSTFEYNDVWSATGTYASSTWPVADQTGLNGNISVNPNFVNAAQGDFELNYGSPCIDAADGAVAPLTDLTGAPRYNDPRTLVKAGIKNANGLYPDMGAFEFVQTASSPIDLIANSVMGPATETAGQTVTVQWNDVNIGTANAIGPWHDTISLVSQGGSRTLAVATVLVAQNVVLGHGQSYPASASVVVPGGQAGSYQWQVQVNSKGDVFEGINWTNNTALATASSVLGDPSLAVGGAPMTNTFTAAGQSRVFTFVSSGGTFALNAQGSTPGCALKLLVGDGYVPDSSRFDFESSQFNSPMASVTVPSNNHDTYYVVVYAISLDASAVSFTLTASTVAFALNSVNPASMVNSGPVTLQVLGGQLAANDTYTLAGPGGTFAATSMQSPDSTVAYATFNLGGAAAGLYNLQVAQPGGPTLTLSNAVVVTSASAAAAAPSFSVQLEIPPAYRANRPFSGAIVYSDTGEVNMPAPILILTSGGVAGMALSGSTDYSTGDLVLVGASFEGPAGTLIPGKSWSIGFSALCTSEATIPFEVDYETADSTNLIDYSTLESSLRPPGYSDANWNEIWNRFQTEAGPTWGGFVSLVDSYSTEMALENSIGTFYLLPDVLAFAYADLLDKASANAIGTVYLHDTNHPAAGVQILLSNDGGTNSSSDTTASDGTFAIDGLPPGTYKVSAPGYWLPAPITVTIPDSDIIAGLAIIVNQGGSISGTLSNAAYGGSPSPASPAYIAQEAGQFLSGISVEAFGESTNAFTTTSDQNGYYSFPGLPPDIYEIVELGGTFGGTTPSSGVQFAIEYATNLVVSDGISLVQDFLVPINGAVAEAQVYAANTSIPITNATVDIGVAPNMIDSTNTDKNGVFAFSVNGSSFMVDISAPGYVAFAGMVGASPNPSRPSIIYLTPASSFDITLNTSSATAITNGVVTVTSNGVVVGMGTTDGNGQVTIGNLAAGTYTVQAGAYGFQDTSTTLTVGVGDVATSSSTMAALGGIIGQVSNDNGVPISGIDVTVYGDGATNQGVDVTIQTDTSGNYAVLGLPPGKYGVSVGNDGGVDPQEIRIVSNEQRTVNFTLAGSVIQGIVLAPDGVTPVPLATVALAQAGEILATALSDTNGNYTFRVLIPGRYALAASASTGLSSNQAVALKSGANLQAAPLVFGPDMLNILVTDTSDNPLTSASIALYPANGVPTVPQIFTEMTDSSGAAAIGGLVAGQYRIVVHQPGFAQFWQTLNLSGNSNITCALNPGVTMSGRITDSTGLPIGQATVALFDPAADMLVASTNTDSAGDYSLTDLYTGSFDVVISQSNYATTEIANVVVNANPFRQKGVLVSKTTSISGTVTDSLGNPLATGLVVITNNGGVVFAMLPTARDGTWSTDQLPPGAYTITIAALGYQPPPPAAVVLLAGNPATLSNALAACVTDDDDEEGISDDGFYANLSVGFGDLIKDVGLNVRPYQISVPGIPAAGDCDKAKQALAACKAALELKENAYINWDEGYRGTSEALGATASIGLVHTLVAAVDALAKFTPAGAGEYLGLAAMNGATKATVVSTSIATTLAHLSTTLDGLQHNLASVNLKDPESLTQFLSSTAADLTANGLDASTMRNLSAGLAEANPGNPYAVAAGAITILNDLWTGIKDYQSAMGIDQANKFAYETATKNYIHALVALENANIDCPPPKPPPIPPPNPIPGPKQPINPVHSGDPNDKFATGIGLPGWVPEGSAITYTIDFENEPNASAAAQEVTISDPLAGNLDWSTLQLTTIAFNNVVINIPAGVQTFSTNVSVTTDPNPVAVSASLNPVTGVISWLMESIDPATGQLIMDPSAGFLPPDNAQGQGEGYVIYTVQPKSGLATGAQLTNRASIVFDVNAAIATPTTTNYVGSGAPIITEQPQNVTTNLGGTAIFTVTLSSNAPYFYQWSKNGTTLAGATNSDLVLGDVQVADAGNYAVSVSTGIASTNSAPAVLTVTTNPSINQIEIVISGNGTVSPHDNGKALQIGHHYAITAIPGRNYLFAGWTGDAFTDAPTLKFVMQSNMLLQASFVTNIFLAAHGNYLGLFAPATAAREQTNSGSFNLNVTTAGVVSGSLVIGLQPVSLNGKFDVTGAAEIHSSRRGQSPLTTTLQLDLANRAVEGTVSDGSFVATLDGEQSVFSASHPATAFEGQYTLIIPGTSDPAAGPFGVSYGTVAVSALGTVTLGGSLADGTPISQSSVVSKEGYWPLYVSLYGGKGSLWGWNYFANHTITNAGALSWINETNSSKTALYRAGFTNQEATITGGLYVPNFELPDDLIVKLEGGNLPSPITVPNLSENVDKLTLKTNKATGVISGSFANPVMLKQIIKVNGVILQGQTKAQGYFLGTNQSGIFRLDPP